MQETLNEISNLAQLMREKLDGLGSSREMSAENNLRIRALELAHARDPRRPTGDTPKIVEEAAAFLKFLKGDVA